MKTQIHSKEKADISYIFQDMLHVLPAAPSRTREKDYKREFLVNWGKIEKLRIVARETLNTFDLLTLLALVRLFIENPSRVKDGGMWKDATGKKTRKMYVTSISPYEFITKYRKLPWGSRNKKLVFESLERLRDCTWTYFYTTKEFTSIKILFDFQCIENQWHLWVNSKYIDAARRKDNFLKIVLNFVSKCQTDVDKLLILWLQGQKNNTFKEKVIANALHIQCKTKEKTRQQLKKAFEDAVRAKFIIWYKVEKRTDGIYFIFEKRKVQLLKGYLIHS
ncbi:hypothetical protein [Desulfonauticus submarinus]